MRDQIHPVTDNFLDVRQDNGIQYDIQATKQYFLATQFVRKLLDSTEYCFLNYI